MFDSGVGGVSVLRALTSLMPHARFVYVADTAFAPYGERSAAYVLDRAEHITRYLAAQRGCAAVVVACNTATAVAIAALRAQWPTVPVVGVEPAVKPAVAVSPGQCIGVMATPATLRHERFAALLRAHASRARVVTQACAGLAAAIETGDWSAPALHDLLDQYCAPLREQQIDTLVLGCTHYVFVQDLIAARMGPGVHIIDAAQAVARQTLRQCPDLGTPLPPAAPRVELRSTGATEVLQHIAQRWLPQGCAGSVQPL